MLSARSRTLIDLATTVVIVATCGALVWANRTRIWPPAPPPVPEAPVSIEGAPSKGDPAAPVVIVMYTDYQCPYCAVFERETLPALVRDYVDSGNVRLAVRHHPLEEIHPLAFQAAVAATCAERQGRFWEMHDRLVAHQKTLDVERLDVLAEEAGLDISAFGACALDPDAGALVRADIDRALAQGLTGTPAFLVGRIQENGALKVRAVVKGAQPVGTFAREIELTLRPARRAALWQTGTIGGLSLILSGSAMWLYRRRSRDRSRLGRLPSHRG